MEEYSINKNISINLNYEYYDIAYNDDLFSLSIKNKADTFDYFKFKELKIP